jgi:uncharacterized protein (TIGR02246 family)
MTDRAVRGFGCHVKGVGKSNPHRPSEVHCFSRQLAAGALGTAAALIVVSSPVGPAAPAVAAEAEIRAALERWRDAFNDRDEQRLCDLFAPDVVANYEGQPQRDYASLCQLLQTTLQDHDRTYRYSFKVDQILVYGDSAVVRAVWTLEIDEAGAAKQTIEEPAVDIFRRQADGSWKISRYQAYSPPP